MLIREMKRVAYIDSQFKHYTFNHSIPAEKDQLRQARTLLWSKMVSTGLVMVVD